MRSKLFVPGIRPELFAKALASAADALSIDLEDSVPESGKAAARAVVGTFLASLEPDRAHPLLIVRCNGHDTPHFEQDLMAVVRRGLTLINLPKCESATEIVDAVAVLERVEAINDVAGPVSILANIETPRGLRNAADIGAAHPRVVGLQLGLGDLFEPLGIERADRVTVHAAMFAVRMAAGEAGVFAIDGAFADVKDLDGYRREAEMSRGIGFIGKSCVHPTQIAIANEVFKPSARQVEAAQRIVDGAHAATARDHGAFLVDGRMIDGPFLRRAEAIVHAARDATGKRDS